MTKQAADGSTTVRPDRRRTLLVVVAVVLTTAIVFVVFVTVRDIQRSGRPTPSFPSLSEAPDVSLHGTVAFISEAKHPGDPQRQACARIALASGAAARDVYCWSIDEPAQATAVWGGKGRLLVTSFRAPKGDRPPEPDWAKYVDVATGHGEEVTLGRLGIVAEPASGDRTNPKGQHLMLEGGVEGRR